MCGGGGAEERGGCCTALLQALLAPSPLAPELWTPPLLPPSSAPPSAGSTKAQGESDIAESLLNLPRSTHLCGDLRVFEVVIFLPAGDNQQHQFDRELSKANENQDSLRLLGV